jgi:hypothetical protein
MIVGTIVLAIIVEPALYAFGPILISVTGGIGAFPQPTLKG